MATTLQQATLSDGLEALIEKIEPTTRTGLVWTRADVAVLLTGLRLMRDEARHLETIVDRARWNDKARREALEGGIADGIVTVLPIVRRPSLSPEGGAA